MTTQSLLAFLVVAGLVVAVPGPTVMLVMGYGMAQGRQAIWKMALGVGLGDLTAMGLSALGVGTLLSVWPWGIWALRWAGAAYLVYLGVALWRAPVGLPALEAHPGRAGAPPQIRGQIRGQPWGQPWGQIRGWGQWAQAWRPILRVFVVTAVNPQGLLFFTALMPQFLVEGLPYFPQILVLGGAFLGVSVLNTAVYAWLAGAISARLRGSPVAGWVSRVSGGVLVVTGVLTAWLH